MCESEGRLSLSTVFHITKVPAINSSFRRIADLPDLPDLPGSVLREACFHASVGITANAANLIKHSAPDGAEALLSFSTCVLYR